MLVLSTFAFNLNVLFPLLADRTLDGGAGTFGLIAAVFGAGALVGALADGDAAARTASATCSAARSSTACSS